MTLALDYIGKQLQKGLSSSTDVLSLVVMRDSAEVVISKQPMDWILFNRVIDLLHSSRPMHHGKYIPALEAAEKLLLSNSHGSCALMLCFLSDGQPSDTVGRSDAVGRALRETIKQKKLKLVSQRIEALASRFGRRLTVASIGFSGVHEDFQVCAWLAGIVCSLKSHVTSSPATAEREQSVKSYIKFILPFNSCRSLKRWARRLRSMGAVESLRHRCYPLMPFLTCLARFL